ncbi:MAG: oligosaccharide flippase family protein [Bacteroidia bacterium]|nr:oligosaccharide flippase family protein [Bacteroidia bacterium]
MGLFGWLLKRFDRQSKILFKNTSWILGSTAFRSVMSFLKSIVVARGLGVEFYGIYIFISNFVLTVQDFFDMNIDAGIIRFGAVYRSNNRMDKLISLIKISVLSIIVSSLISILLIVILVNFFYDKYVPQHGLEMYIILFAIADLSSFFDPLGKSLLRLYYKFKINSIIQSLSSLLELIVVSITIIIFKADLKAFFISLIIARLLTAAAYIGGMWWELKDEFRPHLNAKINLIKDQYREIFIFMTGNAMTRTLITLINRGDALLLGTLAGPASLAFYNLSKRLANMFMVVADPFAQGIYPQISYLLAEKKFKELKLMLIKLTRSTALPLALSIPVVFFIHEWFISLFYGAEYIGAARPFMYLYVASILATVFFWNQSFMLGTGNIKARFTFIFISALIGFFISYLLIPDYKDVGMAIGNLILRTLQFSSMAIFSFHFLNKKLNRSAPDG